MNIAYDDEEFRTIANRRVLLVHPTAFDDTIRLEIVNEKCTLPRGEFTVIDRK